MTKASKLLLQMFLSVYDFQRLQELHWNENHLDKEMLTACTRDEFDNLFNQNYLSYSSIVNAVIIEVMVAIFLHKLLAIVWDKRLWDARVAFHAAANHDCARILNGAVQGVVNYFLKSYLHAYYHISLPLNVTNWKHYKNWLRNIEFLMTHNRVINY